MCWQIWVCTENVQKKSSQQPFKGGMFTQGCVKIRTNCHTVIIKFVGSKSFPSNKGSQLVGVTPQGVLLVLGGGGGLYEGHTYFEQNMGTR